METTTEQGNTITSPAGFELLWYAQEMTGIKAEAGKYLEFVYPGARWSDLIGHPEQVELVARLMLQGVQVPPKEYQITVDGFSRRMAGRLGIRWMSMGYSHGAQEYILYIQADTQDEAEHIAGLCGRFLRTWN
jgi:hypothetical protein